MKWLRKVFSNVWYSYTHSNGNGNPDWWIVERSRKLKDD